MASASSSLGHIKVSIVDFATNLATPFSQGVETATLPDALAQEQYRAIVKAWNALTSQIHTLQSSLVSSSGTCSDANMASIGELTALEAKVHLIYLKIHQAIYTHKPLLDTELKVEVAGKLERFATTPILKGQEKLLAWLLEEGIDVSKVGFRRIVGDGNCFYHSIAASLLDLIRKNPSTSDTIVERLTSYPLSPSLLKEKVISFFQMAKENPAHIESMMADPNVMMKISRCLRELAVFQMFSYPGHYNYDNTFITSLQMDFPELFKKGIPTSFSYEEAIRHFVQTMGVDATHYSIAALVDSLGLHAAIYDARYEAPIVLGNETSPLPFLRLVREGEHYFILSQDEVLAPASVETARAADDILSVAVHYTGPELTIRGNGATILVDRMARGGAGAAAAGIVTTEEIPLSWDKGINLPSDSDILSLRLKLTAEKAEFKFLSDGDTKYCIGPNYTLRRGETLPLLDPLFQDPFFTRICFHAPLAEGEQFVLLGKGTILSDDSTKTLSWTGPGVPLHREADDRWSMSLASTGSPVEFKICKKDASGKITWELDQPTGGPNRKLGEGKVIVDAPRF